MHLLKQPCCFSLLLQVFKSFYGHLNLSTPHCAVLYQVNYQVSLLSQKSNTYPAGYVDANVNTVCLSLQIMHYNKWLTHCSGCVFTGVCVHCFVCAL